MAKIISMFNHKGGVSKTTTVFNLAWMLARQGKKVIMVDADPQCNLTGVVLGINPSWDSPKPAQGEVESDVQDNDCADTSFRESQERAEEAWSKYESISFYEALRPAFESEPKLLEPVDCVPVEGCDGLFLLPGSLNLGEYDVTLSVASELSSSLLSFRNVPGAANYLLRKTAEHMGVDYVIVDMNPSLGALNQNLVCISDLLVVPAAPDYFSVMALRSLSKVLPRWIKWAERASENEILMRASYSFPKPKIKLVGVVIQRFRLYRAADSNSPFGTPTSSFRVWIERVVEEVERTFVPALEDVGMTFSDDVYRRVDIPDSRVLAKIQEFNSLLPRSQECRVPVFELTDEQLGQQGVVLEASRRQISSLHRIFTDMAKRIIYLG